MVKLPEVRPRAAFVSFVGTVVGVGYIIKDYNGGKKYTYQTDAAKNKLFLITGANSGIGKGLAKELAFRKAKLVLACRDMNKCEYVAASLKLHSRNPNIKCMHLDLSDQQSIRNFAEEFNKSHKRLDVLVNNAGVFGLPRREVTKDGIEAHFGVNYLGHFLLTDLLLPKLKESAPSRIINVISITYRKGVINKEDLNSVKEYDAMKAYNQSKLATVLFTRELAEHLKGTGVTVNAVYPGVVNTRLMRHTSYYNSYFSSIFLKPFVWIFIKNLKYGSQPVLYAAIEPEIQNDSGYLFGHNFVMSTLRLPETVDDSTCKWLWEVSRKWTGLL